MINLPVDCDLAALGLEAAQITAATLISRRHGPALYRLRCGRRSFVCKWFEAAGSPIEPRAYALLVTRGVLTLPVYGRTNNALLLEDLEASPTWRLATEADMDAAETGVAVARWYRQLHAAGRAALASPPDLPEFLRREADILDPGIILQIGEALGLPTHPAWQLAADNIERLKAAMRALPETLTYNDFHSTNLVTPGHTRTAGHRL